MVAIPRRFEGPRAEFFQRRNKLANERPLEGGGKERYIVRLTGEVSGYIATHRPTLVRFF